MKFPLFSPCKSVFKLSLTVLIIIVLLSSSFKSPNRNLVNEYTQNLNYTVYVSGSKRGTLHAQLIRSADKSFKIRLETNIHFPFTNVLSLIQVNYTASGLESASSFKKINNHLNEQISLQKTNGGYILTNDAGQKNRIITQIPFSVGRLYHHEPLGMKELFSERLGAFVPIKNLREGEYELIQPDGKKNVFVYRYGICTEMRTEMMACNVRFVLSE
jgi:hypothetical protein